MLPETSIIVASGRVNEAEANEFKTLGVYVLLDNPFTQEQLAEAWRKFSVIKFPARYAFRQTARGASERDQRTL